ncbi:hypothetical protein ABH39_17980 [Mycobacterium haemophilum]|uniref:Uncharacterized protein n=1 Tax=Mycobacterium haemophilum TaxID=29311 RepID=A0A0I9TXU2_9MYCO|nr:hypothetical protein ABH39_17980 [Mycobacterium haemophilum]KLO34579.1 hypothetical protein ABH38_18440 [Mycobacterium haemophilum]
MRTSVCNCVAELAHGDPVGYTDRPNRFRAKPVRNYYTSLRIEDESRHCGVLRFGAHIYSDAEGLIQCHRE